MAYLLADAGKTTGLTVLVHGLRDPVNPGIPADLVVSMRSVAAHEYSK